MNTTAETRQDVSNYFFIEKNEKPSFYVKIIKPLFGKIRYYAIQIWPYVIKMLNTIFYFLLRLIKGAVKYSLRQLGVVKE